MVFPLTSRISKCSEIIISNCVCHWYKDALYTALALNSHAGCFATSTEEDTNRYREAAKLQKYFLSGNFHISDTIIS